MPTAYRLSSSFAERQVRPLGTEGGRASAGPSSNVVAPHRTATPSLRRNRSAWRRGATAAPAGVFLRHGPVFSVNRGHVRPSSSVATTVERDKMRICRNFAKPSDGLEPSTPSPWRIRTVGTPGYWPLYTALFPQVGRFGVRGGCSWADLSCPGGPATCPQNLSPRGRPWRWAEASVEAVSAVKLVRALRVYGPHVSAHARPDVPVSCPRSVVRSQNEQRGAHWAWTSDLAPRSSGSHRRQCSGASGHPKQRLNVR